MSDFKVLIVGAGIAGSVAAYWIGKTGAQVTVIETTPELRTVGQGLDMQGKAREVVKRMGVLDAIHAKATKESGAAFVKANNEVVAAFDLGNDGSGAGGSPTSEIEIMRKDLAEILYQAASSIPSVTFKFNTEFLSMSEEDAKDGSGVKVEFADGSAQIYDLVIGADGLGSQTRKAMLGPEAYKASFKPVGAYVAYFSIPAEPQDGPRARWYTTTGHRSVAIRPYTKTVSSVYLVVVHETPELQKAYSFNDQTHQKQVIANLFKDVHFQEVPRILKAMMTEQNFYFQRVAQVKIPSSSWSGSKQGGGRITLAGDAGYCPSLFTGMGTSLAILGSYVLAYEIASEIKTKKAGSKPDVQTALSNYAEKFAPYVEEAQSIPFWGYMPKIFNPGTWLGVWVLSTLIWAADRLGLIKILSWLGDESPIIKSEIPEFPF